MHHETLKGNLDVLVLTMKPEEKEAVDRALGKVAPVDTPERCPAIGVSRIACNNQPHTLAVAHAQLSTQGPNAAQELATYLSSLLEPKWLFVVGICGVTPKEPLVTLGDVLVASRVYGPLNRAQAPNQPDRSADQMGGPLPPEIEAIATRAREAWNSDPESALAPVRHFMPKRPSVNLRKLNFVDAELISWNSDIRSNLERHFAAASYRPHPRFDFCPFFSDAILRKDPAQLEIETRSKRDVVGIEMEIGGVLIGVRRAKPPVKVTTIRGVSDIVGLRREEAWTNYAAAAAAAGLRLILVSGLPPSDSKDPSFDKELERILADSHRVATDAGITPQTETIPTPISPASPPLQTTGDSTPVDSDEPSFPIASIDATTLLEETIIATASPQGVTPKDLRAYAEKLGLFSVDRFVARLLIRGKTMSPGGAQTISEILGDHYSRYRPQGDYGQIRAECSECALHRHWGIERRKPFHKDVERFVAQHQLIRDYLIAVSLAWRYHTYASGPKKKRGQLERLRLFMDRVYGFRVNQILKEVIAQKSKHDFQFEQKIASTVKELLALPDSEAIAPVSRTHIYYMAGRITSGKLRPQMAALLEDEANRFNSLVKRAGGRGSVSQYLMMWRSLYVSLGYLGNTKRLCEYIQELLTDPEQDEHNRGFHLEYYGDQKQEAGPTASIDLLEDFSRTKNMLMARLSKQSSATLLEAQTLASLAQKRHEAGRLDAQSRIDVSKTLKAVLRWRIPTHSAEDLNHYLEMVASDLLVEGFRPESILHSINRVRHEPRGGWKDRGSPRQESVGAHSFNAMALAMDFLPEEYSAADGDNYSKLAIVSMLFVHDRPEGITKDIPDPVRPHDQDEVEEAIMRTYGLLETYRLGRGDGTIARIGFARGRNLFVEFQRQKTFNSRVAKEIDRIDAIYEAMTIIAEVPDLRAVESYHQLIARYWPRIKTELGLFVLERVMRMDPRFNAIAEAALAHGVDSNPGLETAPR